MTAPLITDLPVPPDQQPKRIALAKVQERLHQLDAQIIETTNPRKMARLAQAKAVLESYFGWDDFSGSDVWYELRGNGTDDPQRWIPLSVPSDRRHGTNWPIWRWDQDLDRLRNYSRMLCTQNAYARGLLQNMTNSVIGKGFAYECQPMTDLPATVTEETATVLAKSTQRVVDDFLRRNHWNGLCNPKEDTAPATGTREREGFSRVHRDGDALLRFFFEDDGTTEARFVEPEQLRNPATGPDGEAGTYEQGWSFGIRHKMHPHEDTETAEYYHFVYQDSATAPRKDGDLGELVDAKEIVHIKPPGTDMAVKRGIPSFSFETAQAFARASKIQKNLSMATAVRAATAEIWKHNYGTQSQINQLAAGLQATTVIDPVSQKNLIVERTIPGQIRRVPFGQEPVSQPNYTGVPDHLQAAQGDLRQGCTAFCAPEYMAGSTNDANFATAQEAGTPWVNNAESQQEHFKAAYLVCVWKAVRWAVECGKLPADVLEVVEIQVEAPQVKRSDALQKAQEDQILSALGKSPQTILMERGLDPDVEMQNTEEYHERMGQTGQPLQMPDENGNLPAGSGEKPPAPAKISESAKFDEDKHPRGQPGNPGQFGSGGGSKKAGKPAEKKKAAVKQPETPAEAKVKPTKERAFNGKPVPLKTQLSKQDSGKIGEAIVIGWLKSQGFKDARHLNTEQNNYAIDLIQDHESIEAKTGLVSNNPKSQRWRLTIGEPGKEEKAWLAKASPEDKAAWNAKKQQKIHDRKKKALAEISKAVGRNVKAATVTVLLNPDTGTADIYKFDGWHDYIGWNSPEAKKAYVGSVKYDYPG